MDRARTDRGRVTRLVTRALFVLGGTVAATAVGWLISSASASADTLPNLTVPGTHAAPASVSTASTTASNTASIEFTGVLRAVGVPTIPPPPAVIGALSGAVTQLGNRVPVDRDMPMTGLAARPATPPQVSPPAPAPAGQSDPAIGQAAARPITAVTTVAPDPSGPATVVRLIPRQVAALPAAPVTVPDAPAPPWSPVTVPAMPAVPTVPTVPGGTGTAGGAPGGSGIGQLVTSGVLPVPGLDAVRVIPATVPAGRITAGKQPGITPD